MSQMKAHLKAGRIGRAFTTVRWAVGDRFHEWRYGIRTRGVIDADGLGLPGEQHHYYEPGDYSMFHEIMRRLPIRAGRDVFVEIGAGMGRGVVVAATRPFREVVGLDISPLLTRIADENVQRARGLRCPTVRILTQDATTFDFPTDSSVIYMNNPFHGDVLDAVLGNLRRSIEEHPRPVTVVYSRHMQPSLDPGRFPWLRKTDEFRVGLLKPCPTDFYEARPA
jgi:SAM-dependent methyltransferase